MLQLHPKLGERQDQQRSKHHKQHDTDAIGHSAEDHEKDQKPQLPAAKLGGEFTQFAQAFHAHGASDGDLPEDRIAIGWSHELAIVGAVMRRIGPAAIIMPERRFSLQSIQTT
jgi:hypothetical protein